jgi:hypothetical protein
MADPSPDDVARDPESTSAEGLTPDGDDGNDDGTKPQGRTYPEAYVRQLRREAATLRSRLGEVEEKLQEREDSDKSEHERLSDRAGAAEQRAQEAEARLLRFEIAAEHGLDTTAVQFLTGATREEIEHRAEELAKLLAEKPSHAAAGFDGGARQRAPEHV